MTDFRSNFRLWHRLLGLARYAVVNVDTQIGSACRVKVDYKKIRSKMEIALYCKSYFLCTIRFYAYIFFVM